MIKPSDVDPTSGFDEKQKQSLEKKEQEIDAELRKGGSFEFEGIDQRNIALPLVLLANRYHEAGWAVMWEPTGHLTIKHPMLVRARATVYRRE